MSCYEHADNCCVEWCKGCQRGAIEDPLERAVIEAAKAWHAADTGRERYHAEKELQLTVEALQAPEARDE